MSEIEVRRSDLAVADADSGDPVTVLMRLRALRPLEVADAIQPSSAMLGALTALGVGSAQLQSIVVQAAQSGAGLVVTFPPEVVSGLRSGTFHLMQSSNGLIPTALDASNAIVANSRVVGNGAIGGVAGGAAGSMFVGASASALAVAALPIVIAGAAAYAQQRQLEKSLASIKEVVERIEARLEDTDNGICDAAERFLSLVQDALVDGGLTPYLRLELAAHRTAVEALYNARRQWVNRFKAKVEQEQIERERSKGRGQPWVDSVAAAAKNGKLEQELTLFIRSLLSRTKLSVLAAAVLAEEGRGSTAMKLIGEAELELRSQFFDLHNRLRPLARIAPEQSLLQKLPGLGASTQRAHESIKALVTHLDEHVLPSIPDPHAQLEVRAALNPATVVLLASSLAGQPR